MYAERRMAGSLQLGQCSWNVDSSLSPDCRYVLSTMRGWRSRPFAIDVSAHHRCPAPGTREDSTEIGERVHKALSGETVGTHAMERMQRWRGVGRDRRGYQAPWRARRNPIHAARVVECE